MKLLQAKILQRCVIADGGCWQWTGSITRGGYGTISAAEIKTTAHRAAYMAWHGPVSDEVEIDHLCKNTKCVNPDHLQSVTHLENVHRSSVCGRTHCVAGHEYSSKNTYIRNDGHRQCRVCSAINQKRLRSENLERYRANDARYLQRKREKK